MWVKGNYYKAVVWYVTRMHNVLESVPNTKKEKKKKQKKITTNKSYDLFATSKINYKSWKFSQDKKDTYTSAKTIRVRVTFSMVNLVFPPLPAILPIALDRWSPFKGLTKQEEQDIRWLAIEFFY